MKDLELLALYEPVVRYTHGEMFFPCAVDAYLRQCRLWVADSERRTTLLAQPGELTNDVLATYRTVPQDHRLFLQFVDVPLNAIEYQRWRQQPERPRLPHPNRLQRVGLLTRVFDGIFSLALLVRGRVPGGTAAAAEMQYAGMQRADPRRTYYGRVLRDGGYIILHYLFFYPMNDWRSSFHGVNDHESDWEQVFVYLSDEGDAPPQPRWVAFASHDFSGDDLRRRWDDPEVEKAGGTHPVIYAGAGSHASYFSQGEYLMGAEPKALGVLAGFGAAIDRLWTKSLRQGTPLNLESGIRGLLTIPFVDYARGDGRHVGPGAEEPWAAVLIGDADGWVDGYRGLWGLDTWDPVGGERAPSGPKYNRDGSVRLSWRDPLAWAGLDKVLPPRESAAAMAELLADFQTLQDQLAREIDASRTALRKLALEVEALRSTEYLSDVLREREADLVQAEKQLHQLNERANSLQESQEAGSAHLARLQAGEFGPPRAHIAHANKPQPPAAPLSRLAYLWAAASGGLLLLLVAALIYVRPPHWPIWLAGIAVLFGALDAVVRGKLASYLIRLTVVLALVTSGLLLYRFWLPALVLGFAALAIIMIRDNVREVFGR